MWTVCTILSLADIIMPVLATVLSREEKKKADSLFYKGS